jgi:hypothetical protein
MTLTKDSTREEFEEVFREVYFSTPPEREFVVYAPPKFWEAVDIAIEEEFKKLIKK